MSFWQGVGLVFVIFYPLTAVVFVAALLVAIYFTIFLIRRCWRWRRIPCLIICFVVASLILSSCANTSDEPLTIINPNTAIGPLEPDHLDYGELP